MSPRVIAPARSAIEATTSDRGMLSEAVFVDNRYPLNAYEASSAVGGWADSWGATLLRPHKNLGGHGGQSAAIRYLDPKRDDIVFVVDPDSYPLQDRWMTAMAEAMKADPKIGTISLNIQILPERSWQYETLPNGIGIKSLPHPEMYNVTAFRGAILDLGLQARFRYYGGVEMVMSEHLKRIGYRQVYLADYHEGPNPETHDSAYITWKQEHVSGKFNGNFDQYVKENLNGG
jgi:hypothetical protein